MKKIYYNFVAAACAALLINTPSSLLACACGFVGGYEAGTASNFPDGPGGMVWTEYDFISQSQNWSGTNPAPADNNHHKLIQTTWLSGGFQYFLNNKWGVSVVVPSAQRILVQQKHGHGHDEHMEHKVETVTKKWWGMGDMRVNAYYTGFSSDMSTGVNLGLKLPTGDWSEPDVSRSNQIGTGSTDILCGIYHRHRLTSDGKWVVFGQAQLDAPVITQGGYNPGMLITTSTGIYYAGLNIGKVKIRPIGQVNFINQASDTGDKANTSNSGYQQLALTPGIEFDIHPVRLYTDVQFPVMNNVVGNQLVAPCTVRVILSYLF